MAREILVLNDWITPHLNYLLYFEKPMMFMWLVAISYKIFGITEFAARFIPYVSALGGVWLIWLMATKLWGKRAGLIAALSLITSIEYFVLSQVVDMNMTLTLFITATMVFFWLGHAEQKGIYYLLSWACAGLAVLTKGPVGIILPLGSIGLYLLVTRQPRLIKEARPILGSLIFLIITLPWYVWVSLKNPDFFSFFFIDQNIVRYTTTEHSRYQPWWYFIPVIIGGFLPWSFMIPTGAREVFWSKRFKDLPNEIWYIAFWFLFMFLFFTPSNSKIGTYVLPCFAPLALFMGHLCKDSMRKGIIPFSILVIIWTITGIGIILFPELASRGFLNPSHNTAPLMNIGPLVGIIILAGTIISAWLGKRYDTASSLACLSITLMLVITIFAPRWDTLRSTKALVSQLPDNAKLCNYVRYFPSSSFYAKRQVYLVDSSGELVFGQRLSKNKDYILTGNEFYSLMKKEDDVYCLVYEKYLQRFRENLPSFAIIGQKNDLYLLRSPGAACLNK